MTLNKIHETMQTSDGIPLLFQVDHRGDILVDGFRIRRADVQQFIVVLGRTHARVETAVRVIHVDRKNDGLRHGGGNCDES